MYLTFTIFVKDMINHSASKIFDIESISQKMSIHFIGSFNIKNSYFKICFFNQDYLTLNSVKTDEVLQFLDNCEKFKNIIYLLDKNSITKKINSDHINENQTEFIFKLKENITHRELCSVFKKENLDHHSFFEVNIFDNFKILNKEKKNVNLGDTLRLMSDYPYENVVDFTLIKDLDGYLKLMCSSGYQAGRIYDFKIPDKFCEGDSVFINWIFDNINNIFHSVIIDSIHISKENVFEKIKTVEQVLDLKNNEEIERGTLLNFINNGFPIDIIIAERNYFNEDCIVFLSGEKKGKVMAIEQVTLENLSNIFDFNKCFIKNEYIDGICSSRDLKFL